MCFSRRRVTSENSGVAQRVDLVGFAEAQRASVLVDAGEGVAQFTEGARAECAERQPSACLEHARGLVEDGLRVAPLNRQA